MRLGQNQILACVFSNHQGHFGVVVHKGHLRARTETPCEEQSARPQRVTRRFEGRCHHGWVEKLKFQDLRPNASLHGSWTLRRDTFRRRRAGAGPFEHFFHSDCGSVFPEKYSSSTASFSPKKPVQPKRRMRRFAGERSQTVPRIDRSTPFLV